MGFLESLRPMFPWEGPPLPFFLGLYWPWVKPTASLSPSPLAGLFREADNSPSPAPGPAPSQIVSPAIQSMPLYENREEIEFPDGFDPETSMPNKIVVHRRYKTRVE